ncbi:MAG: signal peptidase II [Lachnospiraceae bacterium]|nr:signal peptidase II [Lachnospiraceae bacterium]
MKKDNKVSKIIYIVIFVLSVALDQITKNMAVTMLDPGEPVNVIKDVFRFVYTENMGAAFGMMQGRQVLFYIITGLVIIAILYFLIRMPSDSKYLPIGIVLSFILAGAVGNLIDRVSHKYVVDFIYFAPIDFPVFNVADIFVTLGCIAFAILVIFVYKDRDFDFLDPRKKNDN